MRQLGTVVRNDASEARDALSSLASRTQLALPHDDMAPDASARLSDLEKRDPDESFDRALLDEMLRQQRQKRRGELEQVSGDVGPERRRLLDKAALSLREAERATAIVRKPMKH